MTGPRRPLLRYHGGKWKLAPWLIQHFPEHTTYIEPFCGAASVLIRKTRSRGEILNDVDDEIVNLFWVIREYGPMLVQKLELTPFSRTEYTRSLQAAPDPIERARRLIVRSFQGYGSDSCRPGRVSGFRGRFCGSGRSTPAADWQNYPEALVFIINRLRGVVVENLPATELIRRYDRPGTFFYCDPPYPKSTRSACSNGRHTYTHEMTDQDHRDLAAALKHIEGMAIVSGYDCPLYDELYRGWAKETKETLADGAKPRRENIWFSPRIQRGLFQ